MRGREKAWPAAGPSPRGSRLLPHSHFPAKPGPVRQRRLWRRGSRPLTTHFLPRKVKRDSFSCGVSSRDPTLATLRGGGCCCWPELMVSPAELGVQGRLLRRVGERSFPLSVTEAGEGESEAQHLATPPARGEGGGHGKEEPTVGRAEEAKLPAPAGLGSDRMVVVLALRRLR